jgi:purine nucleosidase
MPATHAEEWRAKAERARRPLPPGFPQLGSRLPTLLEPPPPGVCVPCVLDTDTFNEIDDQFAIVQALLSPERIDLRAIYAAPFLNGKSESPGDGMEKSHEEILRLLERMDTEPEGLVHRGSKEILRSWEEPVHSAAASDLIARGMAMTADEGPLYVIAIGAITNVASALLLEPRLAEKIVVVWLGGQANEWANQLEFNLQGDLLAAQLVLDCGVPVVRLPCAGVVTHLTSTIPEIDTFVKGRGAIGDFLAQRFSDYSAGKDAVGYSKEIWDMAAVAWVLDPSWVPTVLEPAPYLTSDYTFSWDPARHLSRTATAGIQRDGIFRDFFHKLEAYSVARGDKHAAGSKL